MPSVYFNYSISILLFLYHFYGSDFPVPTEVPVSRRKVRMEWLGATGSVITTAEQGDDVSAQICYDPGNNFKRK